MEIRYIITDDEPLERKGLRAYIEKINFLSLAGECEDTLQLNAMIRKHPADLVFLDIEMPETSGIDWLNDIQNPPKVIIVSAYEQYALKGYEYNVVDYLLKPVSFNRFLKSVNKVRDFFEQDQRTDENTFLFCEIREAVEKDRFARASVYKKHGKLCDFPVFEYKGNCIHHVEADAEYKPEKLFLQVHRSFVVNIQHIRSVDGNQLSVDKYQIPISRSCKEKVMKEIFR